MVKKVLVFAALFVLLSQGAALAQGSGRIILEDTFYGAVIGGLLGSAVYLLDDHDFSDKLGTGVGLGAIAGFLFGMADAMTLVEVEDGDVKYGMPSILIEEGKAGTVYKVGLLNVKF